MRKKLVTQRTEQGRWSSARNSNIRRYFGDLIDFLLAQHPLLPGEKNGQEATYVSIPSVEKEILEILSHEQSNFWQLVGYKGTGKTTVIRGGLKLWNSSSITQLIDKTLIVYCSFNSVDLSLDEPDKEHAKAVKQVIEGALGFALEIIQNICKSQGGSCISEHEFYDFVMRTKGDVLFRYDLTGENADPKIARLKSWEKANRLTYRAVQLKYEFSKLQIKLNDQSKKENPFSKRQIFIIFDDIEGIANKQGRRELAQLLSPLWNCLRNGVDYPTKILIAHRPHTRDEYMQNQTWTPITIDFKNSLTLCDLLKTRTEKFLELTPQGREMSARQTWQESFAALWSLLTKYGTGESQEVILSLSNNCFRDSLNRLTNLVQFANIYQPRLGLTDGGGFILANIDRLPHLPRANLIDLIGKRGYPYFAPDEKVGIVNLFENDSNFEGTDFLILLLIHWALHYTAMYSNNWPRLVDINLFKNHLEHSLPGHPMLECIDWAIKRAEQLCLFDDVVDQYDTTRMLHHLMPRANVLYQEMEHSSVILELGVHDFFMKEEKHLAFQAERLGSFMLAVKFCEELVVFEESIYKVCLDIQKIWEKIYHRKLLSRHAIEGLLGTMGRWSVDKPSDASGELKKLNQKISKLESNYGH